ncbi:MAG TPA: NAD-dependent deacylase [Verrucomicrobiaceae bacterium]|jgi:NAD-dependent deacetylase
MKTIVILTGAGISAESGLPTFRDANGLWEGPRVEEVATPEAFHRQPGLVHRFYNLRYDALMKVQPNAAHRAIAQLQDEFDGEVALVTQNVDDLHERGGSRSVFHMHGELGKARCERCGKVFGNRGKLSADLACGNCHETGGLRPHIVWFGEMPFHMTEIEEALERATLFVAIGTSGQVYPAAGFVHQAREAGARTIEINNAGTKISSQFEHHMTGPATVQVPMIVKSLLEGKFEP